MANSISVRVKERVLLAASKARGLSAATDTSGRRISMAEFGVRGSWRILQTTLAVYPRAVSYTHLTLPTNREV